MKPYTVAALITLGVVAIAVIVGLIMFAVDMHKK